LEAILALASSYTAGHFGSNKPGGASGQNRLMRHFPKIARAQHRGTIKAEDRKARRTPANGQSSASKRA
jgi:hypothetical protein